jgi:asparagine synthase (glutamine-hydrolysing)
VPEPRTLRREIRAVPAGHLLRVSFADGVRTEGLAYRSPTVETPTIEEALAGSVRDHLVSDVPVAVFLSAGLDSNLVAALACRAAPEPPTALTLTFAEASGTAADEEPLARAAAATLGMRHVVRRVDAASTRAALAEIVAAMDQPSIDGFNTFLVARLAREEGFKVALSGLGGDELFGGYPSFSDVGRWHRRSRTLARFPGIGRLWPRLAARVSSRPKLRGLVSYGGSLAGAYFLRRGLFLPEEIQTHDYDPVLDAWEGLSSELLGPVEGLLADSWRAVHRLESSLYLKNQLLRDADWAGMAHGVEIRVPWVDARLRAEVERLRFEPVRSSGKAALVRRLAPELPAALFSRPKSGFQLPIASWLGLTRPGETVPVGEQSRRLARHVLELHRGSELAAAGIAA